MFLEWFLGVKGCLNAVFGRTRRYGKSTCFLRFSVLSIFRVDCQRLDFFYV